jgi:hypothetical protein
MLSIPYLAGAVGGLLVVRQAPTAVLESAPMRGFCCGLLTGVVLGMGSAFAGGPLGDGRMAAVGPSPWQVTAVASLEVGIAAAVTAGLVNWWFVRRRSTRLPASAPPTRPERAGPWPPDRTATADDEYGHVIYLNRWASDDDDDDGGGAPSGRRSRGPSALP